jgi:hypothetical protein
MCGIWGLLTTDDGMNLIHQNNTEEMFMKSKHRGPDKSSFIVNSNYIIGFHRLAIMDPTNHGDQPFSFSYTYTDDIENIKLFIKKGANINILDKNGLNILQYSLMNDNVIIPQYLSLLVNFVHKKPLSLQLSL